MPATACLPRRASCGMGHASGERRSRPPGPPPENSGCLGRAGRHYALMFRQPRNVPYLRIGAGPYSLIGAPPGSLGRPKDFQTLGKRALVQEEWAGVESQERLFCACPVESQPGVGARALPPQNAKLLIQGYRACRRRPRIAPQPGHTIGTPAMGAPPSVSPCFSVWSCSSVRPRHIS